MTGIDSTPESCTYKRNPKAIFTDLDGETALFQSETCDYLILNSTGSEIWQLLKSPLTANEICDKLTDVYEVDPANCRNEVDAFLSIAIEKEVIQS